MAKEDKLGMQQLFLFFLIFLSNTLGTLEVFMRLFFFFLLSEDTKSIWLKATSPSTETLQNHPG